METLLQKFRIEITIEWKKSPTRDLRWSNPMLLYIVKSHL